MRQFYNRSVGFTEKVTLTDHSLYSAPRGEELLIPTSISALVIKKNIWYADKVK